MHAYPSDQENLRCRLVPQGLCNLVLLVGFGVVVVGGEVGVLFFILTILDLKPS